MFEYLFENEQQFLDVNYCFGGYFSIEISYCVSRNSIDYDFYLKVVESESMRMSIDRVVTRNENITQKSI